MQVCQLTWKVYGFVHLFLQLIGYHYNIRQITAQGSPATGSSPLTAHWKHRALPEARSTLPDSLHSRRGASHGAAARPNPPAWCRRGNLSAPNGADRAARPRRRFARDARERPQPLRGTAPGDLKANRQARVRNAATAQTGRPRRGGRRQRPPLPRGRRSGQRRGALPGRGRD